MIIEHNKSLKNLEEEFIIKMQLKEHECKLQLVVKVNAHEGKLSEH